MQWMLKRHGQHNRPVTIFSQKEGDSLVKVLVVDDHTAIRVGLRQILTVGAKVDRVYESGTGKQALELIGLHDFDAIVLDIDLPDMSGLDVLAEIQKMNPALPVLVLSMYPEEQYSIRVLKAGASGFLSKECAEDELVQAVLTIIEGKKFVSQKATQHMAEYISGGLDKPKHETLSNREFQIMRLMAKGKSNAKIADELGINIKTVFTYRSRIFVKMGVSSNAEIIHYAIQNKLI